MPNELLGLLMVLFNFAFVLFVYRFYGKSGLYFLTPIFIMICNIQVVFSLSIFGIESTLGNTAYACSFLASDIMSENYGKKSAHKMVLIGFIAMVFMTAVMYLVTQFTPLQNEFSQEAAGSLRFIFEFMPRITLASMAAYLLSQTHDVWAFQFWRNIYPSKKHLWIRNNFSTLASQMFDNIIFNTIAFYGVFPFETLVKIMLSTYVIKLIISISDTPVVYLARHWKEKGYIKELQ